MKNPAVIGALGILILTVAFLLAPSISTRDSSVFGQEFILCFNEVSGLREGDDVKFSGISVGDVESIDFSNKEQRSLHGEDIHVLVTITTDYGVKIPVDSSVGVETKTGGTCWVDIIPGNSKEYIKQDSLVRLNLVKPIMSQLGTGLDNLRDLHSRTGDLRESIKDPQFRTNMRDLASNARFYTNELNIASKQASKEVAYLSKKLDEYQSSLLKQIDRADVQVTQVDNYTRELFPKLNEKAQAWDQRIKDSADKINNMIKLADSQVVRFNKAAESADAVVQAKIIDTDIVAKTHKLSNKLENISTLAEDLAGIAHDEEVKQSLKDMAKKYRNQSEAFRDKVKKWEKMLPDNPNNPQDTKYSDPTPILLEE